MGKVKKFYTKLASKVSFRNPINSIRTHSVSNWQTVKAKVRRNKTSIYILLAFLMLTAILVLLAYNQSQFKKQTDQRQQAQEAILEDLKTTSEDINQKSDDNTKLIICVLLALNIDVDTPEQAEADCREAVKRNPDRSNESEQPQQIFIENNYEQPPQDTQTETITPPNKEKNGGDNPSPERPSCEIKIVNNCI